MMSATHAFTATDASVLTGRLPTLATSAPPDRESHASMTRRRRYFTLGGSELWEVALITHVAFSLVEPNTCNRQLGRWLGG